VAARALDMHEIAGAKIADPRVIEGRTAGSAFSYCLSHKPYAAHIEARVQYAVGFFAEDYGVSAAAGAAAGEGEAGATGGGGGGAGGAGGDPVLPPVSPLAAASMFEVDGCLTESMSALATPITGTLTKAPATQG
jgi:hypothetical protein